MVKVIRDIKNADGQTIATQEEEMNDAQYQQYLQDQQAAANVASSSPPSSDPPTTATPADQGKTLHTAAPTASEQAPQAQTTEGLTSTAPPPTKKTKAAKEE